MKKLCSLLIVFCISLLCSSQVLNKNCGSVIVDVNYKGSIEIYDKPNGELIKELKHHFEEEDFLVLNIIDKNDSMYYVNAVYPISGVMQKGWITRKNAALGIYSRAYTGGLQLYQSSSKSSKVSTEIKENTPELYHVLDCNDGWLLVEITLKNIKYKGWMEPAMQCDNPYTTCN